MTYQYEGMAEYFYSLEVLLSRTPAAPVIIPCYHHLIDFIANEENT